MGAVRLPKILVLTIDDFVSAQEHQATYSQMKFGARDKKLEKECVTSSPTGTALRQLAP